MQRLQALLEGDHERVGAITETGEIVEVPNIAPEPKDTFDVSVEDLRIFDDEATATWHTHPNGSSNLSVNDYEAFLNWPHLKHYVIGEEGVRCFVVRNGKVVEDE